MQVHDFTAARSDFAGAPEERAEGRLVVVVGEERGRDQHSGEAHENEHDQDLDQGEPGPTRHCARSLRDHEGCALSLDGPEWSSTADFTLTRRF